MDAIDILGELLGRKKPTSSGSRPSGGGGDESIGDILFGRKRQQAPDSSPMGKNEIRDMARELEDLLQVGKNRNSGGQSAGNAGSITGQTTRRPPSGRDSGTLNWNPGSKTPAPAFQPDEKAVLMIRAILNAAKSDGEISSDEQQQILKTVGDRSPEAIDFLNREIAEPLNVREFAWSVPIGMEEQIYTLSAVSIRFDTENEADYLTQLAHGLRIPRKALNEIHDQYRIPRLPG